MDAILLDGRHGRLWLCKKHEGHALGIILRETIDGHPVERLLVFRSSLYLEKYEPKKIAILPPIKIIGLVEGTIHDIECDLCDAKRTWWMDKKITISMLAPLYVKAVKP
jgi:hypothetical protein